MRMGKLSGIRVVDLSLFLPGPMLTLMMADQGAQVTKVEPPTGDPARTMEPMEGGESVWFNNLNRGKDCRRLDLKTDEGQAALWLLIAATLLAFWRLDRISGACFVPYIAWVSFAAALNFAIWRLNPDVPR